MYASVANHAANGSHYLFAVVLMFLVCPRLLLSRTDGDFLDDSAAGMARMIFLLIVLGYGLVLVRLFELLSLAAIFTGLFVYRYLKRHSLTWEKLVFQVQVRVYDWLEGQSRLSTLFSGWLSRKRAAAASLWHRHFDSPGNAWTTALFLFLFLGVFLYAAYLRFYDAVIHAAPAMSDAYVTLAWMKYINERILFYDGIYPQGFHIILATIKKLAAIDPLYVLKYTGPLNGVLISLGLYHFVSRLSGRSAPGIAAALVYGLLGYCLPLGWERQASTNSQEFAFVFILPAFYFAYRYLRSSRKDDLITAAAAISVTGLVHTVAFAYTGLGVGLLGLSALVADFRANRTRVFHLALASAVTVVLSLLPLGIGVLLGKDLHGSSVEYLVSQTQAIRPPALQGIDYAALLALVPVLISLVFSRRPGRDRLAELFVVLLGTATFCLYYWGGPLTRSTLLESRSGACWALVVPICLGMGWYSLGRIVSVLRRQVVELALLACLLAVVFFVIRPEPIIPYKMEHDANVEQYLRISQQFTPTTWMIVSQEEGYALAMGKGFHLMLQDFLA